MSEGFRAVNARHVPGGRFIWTGRVDWCPIPGLDGWNTDRSALANSLSVASELLILDPLSFPWESLRDADRDIPLVVLLPPELEAGLLEPALRRSLAAFLTPFDLLIESRGEVVELLTRRWGLAAHNWLQIPDSAPATIWAALVKRSDDKLSVVDTPFGRFVTPEDDLITQHLREYGAHQRGALNVLCSLLGPTAVVWDVGAHIGTVSIPLLQSDAAGQVLAVEASPQTAGILARNVEMNGLADQLQVLPRLVTAEEGELRTPALTPANIGATSFAAEARRGSTVVESTTLDLIGDEIGQFPDLIKIDVEGAEVAVLRGGESLIDRCRPLLLVEVSGELLDTWDTGLSPLQDWFDSHDYALFLVGGRRNFVGTSWALVPVQTLKEVDERLFDVLAVPKESPVIKELVLEGGHADG